MLHNRRTSVSLHASRINTLSAVKAATASTNLTIARHLSSNDVIGVSSPASNLQRSILDGAAFGKAKSRSTSTSASHLRMSFAQPLCLRFSAQPWRHSLQPGTLTAFTSVRHCNSGPANNTRPANSRSTPGITPFHQSEWIAQPKGPPELIVISPLCDGLLCPFFAYDPARYPRCHDQCTARGKDPMHWLRRHLDNSHQEDAAQYPVEEAIKNLMVANTKYDERSAKPEEKWSPESKLAGLYKEARHTLFGTEKSQNIKRHFPKHVRTKNRSTENASDRGRISRSLSQKQNSRGNSRAVSRAASRASSSSMLFATRQISNDAHGGLDPDNDDNDDHHHDACQDRIDNINKRLSTIGRTAHQHRGAFDGLYSLLDQFEWQLSNLERQIDMTSYRVASGQMMGIGLHDSLQSSTPNGLGIPRQPLFQELSPSVSSPQHPSSDYEIDLYQDPNNYQATSASVSIYSDNTSHVPQGETWQESIQPVPQESFSQNPSNQFLALTAPNPMTSDASASPFLPQNSPLLNTDTNFMSPLTSGNPVNNMSWPSTPLHSYCSNCESGLMPPDQTCSCMTRAF